MKVDWEPYPYRAPPLDRIWAHGDGTGLDAFGWGTWVHVAVGVDPPEVWILERHDEAHRWGHCDLEMAIERFVLLCQIPDAPWGAMMAAFAGFAGPVHALRLAARMATSGAIA